MVPTQEKEHKKKCLLPDDGSFAAGAPQTQAPRNGKQLQGTALRTLTASLTRLQ